MARPNILLVMADQMAALALPFHGHPLVKAANLSRLAGTGVVFDAAYCNSPICAPSRFSMLSGQLPTAIGAYDNAAEFAASTPTLMHYLAAAGYRTILSGKMHFIGPDQLHGFHERLVTDIYPADFAWTPNWLAGPTDKPSGISMRNVVEAGQCVRSLQMDYDDEVEHFAIQRLYDLAREPDRPPFFMTVSFSHPHPPYTIGREHWDRFRHEDIDLPSVTIPLDDRDAHSRWLHTSHGADEMPVTTEQVRNARHAYYGMIEYVDDKVGRLVKTLEDCRLREDTIVVFVADHGEMLGERGMWYKQTFYESSVRVPLVMSGPGIPAGRRAQVCSLVDLLPTFLDVAAQAGHPVEPVDPLAGRSLLPLARDEATAWPDEAVSEYSSEGVIAPSRMVRRGDWKYVYTRGLAPRLFDLRRDPRELVDRAGQPEVAAIESTLRERLLADWDPEDVDRRVRASQRRRLFLRRLALESGAFPDWNYEARAGDAARFVRPATATGAVGAKPRARFPYVDPTPPDRAAS